MNSKLYKFVITFVLALTVNSVNAYNSNDDVVNRVKAIVVYEAVSCRWPDKVHPTIQEANLDVNSKRVSDISCKLGPGKEFDNCKNICNNVQNYDSVFESREKLIEYFRERINKDFENIKNKEDIIQKITSASISFTSNAENSTVDNIPYTQISTDNTRRTSIFGMSNIISCILLCSNILFIFLFLKYKNNLSEYKKNDEKWKKLRKDFKIPDTQKTDDFVRSIITDNKLLKNQVDSLKPKLKESQSDSEETEELINEPVESEESTTIDEVLPDEKNEIVPEDKDEVRYSKEMYLSIPGNDGVFGSVFESFKDGKTLYKLNVKSETSATFEIINEPSVVKIAKQNRTRFIECACIIENDSTTNYNSIKTIKKGQLKYNGGYWEIYEKACVRLV